MKVNMYKDILLLVALFILPLLVFIHPIVGKFDEVIFFYMILAIVTRMLLRERDVLFPILLVVYLLYSLFLIFHNAIPLSHILQIFITSKFLIIFLYFYTYSKEYKIQFFQVLVKFITFLFIISLLMSILQFVLPAYFCGYSHDGRGLMGINAGGVFCSRISYSSFLVVFIILIMSIRLSFNLLFKYRYWLLIISLLLLVLTFARKEMVIGFMILIYLFKDKIEHDSRIVFYLILSLFILGFIVVFTIAFSELNSSTFTEKQIRLLMLFHALDIFQFYFPFGSGPGTYGSIMSLDYTTVYETFNVGKNIYLGHNGDTRGPIFDLFLVGLLAEYGLGVIFFLWFLKKMVFSNYPLSMDKYINVKKVKIALLIHLLVVSIFVPIFLNWVGFLIFTILGILSSRREY